MRGGGRYFRQDLQDFSGFTGLREGWRMAGPTAEGCSGLPKARTRRVFFDRSDQPGTPFRVRSPFLILFALFPPRRASA